MAARGSCRGGCTPGWGAAGSKPPPPPAEAPAAGKTVRGAARVGGDALALLDELGIRSDTSLADYQLCERETAFHFIDHYRTRIGPLPACILTANRSHDVAEACRARGQQLLYKPIDIAPLDAALMASVGRGLTLAE